MRAAIVLALASTVLGCGVSQELYDARGRDLDKLKQQLAAADAARRGDADQCKAQLAAAEAQRKSDEAAARKRLDELQRQEAERAKQFQELTSKLHDMVAAGKLKVEIRNGLMLVKMADNILFDPGKTDLKTEGKTTLKQLAQALAGITGRKFQVAGHTDNQPLGKKSRFHDNWALSTARAVQVVNFMIKDGGMPAARLSAAGWADQMPVASNDTEDGRKQNRRIEVVLMPNIDELPALSSTATSAAPHP